MTDSTPSTPYAPPFVEFRNSSTTPNTVVSPKANIPNNTLCKTNTFGAIDELPDPQIGNVISTISPSRRSTIICTLGNLVCIAPHRSDRARRNDNTVS